MALSIGIVGLPNVGKSTLFTALTRKAALAANYPFATIEPNVGVVPVPDPRLDALAGIAKPESVVPAAVEFVDIAGLVKGANEGEGLGNQFLANIRETDAIVEVVRYFSDDNVIHVTAGRSGRRRRDDQDRARPRRSRHARAGAAQAREGRQARWTPPRSSRSRCGSRNG